MSEQRSSPLTYRDLQDVMDKVLSRFGLNKTIIVLQQLLDTKGIQSSQGDRVRMITYYVVSRCLVVFHLREDDFFSSRLKEYREGRMACYHILRKYTEGSYGRMAEQFGQSQRIILYFCHKCDDMLAIPQFNRTFIQRYNLLESDTLNFIAKLNLKSNENNQDTGSTT
jgi:hypothetical protein